MKIHIYIVGLLSTLLMFLGCSDNDFYNPNDYFTIKDKQSLFSLKSKVTSFNNSWGKEFHDEIVASRLGDGEEKLSRAQTLSLNADLIQVGKQSIATFEQIGISRNEMETLLPYEGNEAIYGMLAVEIVSAIDEPELRKSDYEIAIDWSKVRNCLVYAVSGIDLEDLACIGVGAAIATKKMGKDALMKYIKSVLSSIGSKAACGGVASWVGITAVQWGWCYFDGPSMY